MEQFKVPDGELVEPHVPVLIYPRQVCDMSQLRVLGNIEVVQHSACRDNRQRQVLYSESLERGGLELLQKPVTCRFRGEDPVVEPECIEFCSEVLSEELFLPLLIKNLLVLNVTQQLVDIFKAAFSCKKLAR